MRLRPTRLEEKQTFLTGALILSAAGFLSQLLGVFSKIFLLWLIGEEGVGIYNFPYPFFAIILSFSSVGFNVAISKLVAEFSAKNDSYHAEKVFRLGMRLSLILGLFGSLLLALMAYPMANWVHQDQRALFSYLALAPTAFLTSFQAVYRGYFQGLQNMKPNASSQLIEQVCRILVMLVLAWLLLPLGLTYAAAGATFGAATGAIGASLYLHWLYRNHEKSVGKIEIPQKRYRNKAIYKRILRYAIPISFAGVGLPTFLLADSLLIANRLQSAGVSLSEATAMYGVFANNAMSLIALPTILTSSLFVTLVPAIAESRALDDHEKVRNLTQRGFQWTLLFALPAAVGLRQIAFPLTVLLRMGSTTAVALQTLTFGLPFIALQQVSSGVLQGMGHSLRPVQHMLIGALIKFVGNFILIPILGIHGAALSTVLGFSVAALLNLYHIYRNVGSFFSIVQHLLKPSIAALLMGLSLFLIQRYFLQTLPAIASLLIQTIFGLLIYVVLLLLMKALSKADLGVFLKKQ